MSTDTELEHLEARQFSKRFDVLAADTVNFVSGSFPILSTPAMVGHIERACRTFLLESGGGQSVGASIEIVHSAPALLNSIVNVEAQVDRVERRRVNFSFKVSDEVEMLASGKHTRVVVDLGRATENLAKKAKRLAEAKPI